MFLSEPEVLDSEFDRVENKNATEVRCEFQRIMTVEARELVRAHYETKSGMHKLWRHHRKKQEGGSKKADINHVSCEVSFRDVILELICCRKPTAEDKEGLPMLEMTHIEEKIKLKQMSNTWSMSRGSTICYLLLESIVQIVLSNMHHLTVFAMISSMFANAGLISLYYPLAAYGYAMLEENRPQRKFWKRLKYYTMFVLFIKFFFNMSIMDELAYSN